MTTFAPGATFSASAATLSRSGPTTTAMSPAAPSATAESVCASIERPASSCSTLGRAERMRTPSPAASTMVRQRRALAVMGRLLSRQVEVREAGSAMPNRRGNHSGTQYRCCRLQFPAATRARGARFRRGAKCVSLRRKKRYTTNPPRTERAGLRRGFLLQRLTFHFGWERRRVGPSLRGPGSAANE